VRKFQAKRNVVSNQTVVSFFASFILLLLFSTHVEGVSPALPLSFFSFF